MFPRPSTLCRFAVAGIAIVAGVHLGLSAPARSPFLPQQASGPASPTADAPLEYRGYMTTAEGIQFRIFDPAKKAFAWVKLNERNADLDVIAKQHDGDHKTLTIEHGGRVLTLAERRAKVVSGGNIAQATPPARPMPQPANVAPAVTQSVVLNPTPADEQRRLEAVAAEVARRRALREQATQQVNQGAPQQANQRSVPGGRLPVTNTRQR